MAAAANAELFFTLTEAVSRDLRPGENKLFSQTPLFMNSARSVVTIIFRFVAVSLILWLAYLWIAYLLTPAPEVLGADRNRLQELRLEGMLRRSVVMTLCGVALYLVAPFLGRVVTRRVEN